MHLKLKLVNKYNHYLVFYFTNILIYCVFIGQYMNLREKDIQIFLNFDIPSDSDASFCAFDNYEDDIFLDKTVEENPSSDDNIEELLVTSELIDKFHKEIEEEELRLYNENIVSSSQHKP